MTDSKMMINVFMCAPVVLIAMLAFLMPDIFEYYTSSAKGIVTLIVLIAIMYISVFIASKMRKSALNI